MMNRQELQQWLGAADSAGLAFDDVAEVLHLVLDASRKPLAIADAEELRTLHFTLVVLRDAFVTDADVRNWLGQPLAILGGSSPADLLSEGRVDELAELAIQEWNRPRKTGRPEHRRSFTPSFSAR